MAGVNILILGNPKEFLATGVASLLRGLTYNVDIVAPRAGTSFKNPEAYNCCLIFINSAESIKHFIGSPNNLIRNENLRICIVGSKDDILDVTHFLGSDNVDCPLLRPTDAKSIAAIVENLVTGKIGRKSKNEKSILFFSLDQRLSTRIKKVLGRTYRLFIVPTMSMADAVLQKTHIDMIILDFRVYEDMHLAEDAFSITDYNGEKIPLVVFLDSEDIVEIAKATMLHPVEYLFRTMTVKKLTATIRHYFRTGEVNDKYTSIPYVKGSEDIIKMPY